MGKSKLEVGDSNATRLPFLSQSIDEIPFAQAKDSCTSRSEIGPAELRQKVAEAVDLVAPRSTLR